MPVLHNYRDQRGSYAKAWIRGSIVTFQLSEEGVVQLRQKGVASEGEKFPLKTLIDLIRTGDAFTRGNASQSGEYNEAEQFVFDFAENADAEAFLPRCALTGSFDDLHLVIYASEDEGRTSSLLSANARHVLSAEVQLSVPIGLLNPQALNQLIETKKLDAEDRTVSELQNWFEHRPASEPAENNALPQG